MYAGPPHRRKHSRPQPGQQGAETGCQQQDGLGELEQCNQSEAAVGTLTCTSFPMVAHSTSLAICCIARITAEKSSSPWPEDWRGSLVRTETLRDNLDGGHHPLVLVR